MKPILITEPRTGSTLFCQMLGNIAKQHFGYKSNLNEVFTVDPLYKSGYEKVDGVVRSTGREVAGYQWYESAREEKLKRLALFDNDNNYMIKIFPFDMEHAEVEIKQFVNQYDIVYLERRDKLTQLISFLGMTHNRVSHFRTGSSRTINEIHYDKTWTKFFIKSAQLYKQFKFENLNNHPVVYYEDFMALGGDESAIIQLLNLPLTVNDKEVLKTMPTPYSESNIESLITNKEEWQADRDTIVNELYKTL
jgi:hypothetical protein